MTRSALGQPIRPPMPADKRREAAPRATIVPCLCGSTTYEIVDVGDGLPRTDCCKAY